MMAFSMEAYQEQITVPASTMIQLERYYPFQPASDLARLDHPASLQLTSDYPVVDGATALVPFTRLCQCRISAGGSYYLQLLL